MSAHDQASGVVKNTPKDTPKDTPRLRRIPLRQLKPYPTGVHTGEITPVSTSERK